MSVLSLLSTKVASIGHVRTRPCSVSARRGAAAYGDASCPFQVRRCLIIIRASDAEECSKLGCGHGSSRSIDFCRSHLLKFTGSASF